MLNNDQVLTRVTSQTELFDRIQPALPDAIFDLKELFRLDTNPRKIDLSAGIYQDNEGRKQLFECVREAEVRLASGNRSAEYVPIDGLREFRECITGLLFGSQTEHAGRSVTVQSVGGTSAIRYAADLLKRYFPSSKAYVSAPGWANHAAIFERAGFEVGSYPYYDPSEASICFERLCEAVRELPPCSVLMFQPSCHNPSGQDLTSEQWKTVLGLMREGPHIPILDLSYIGLGVSVSDDCRAVRELAESGLAGFVATSFSKNFSLYDKRVGALTFLGRDSGSAVNVLSQLKSEIRANNSNPPRDGAEIVATILKDEDLRLKWQSELAEVRDRIIALRNKFVVALHKAGSPVDYEYLRKQHGMFSLLDLRPTELESLRRDYGVYMVEGGRICFTSLKDDSIDYVAGAVADILNRRQS